MDPTTGTGPGDMEVEEGAGVAQFDFESESGEGVEEQLATIAPPALLQAAAAAPRPTPLMTTLPEAARLAVHSRNTSCVLRIAPEERRGTASQTETACARLAAEHRVKIERSTNKDQWLTLIISGAPPPPPLRAATFSFSFSVPVSRAALHDACPLVCLRALSLRSSEPSSRLSALRGARSVHSWLAGVGVRPLTLVTLF